MHRCELVKQLGAEKLNTRLKQLCSQQKRQQAAFEQHCERKDQVHRTDVFMVGRVQPTTPAM